MSRRRIALIAALAIAAITLPASARAAQPEGSCGAERGRSFTMPVPDAMRTEGIHRFQYRITVTLSDGSLDIGFTDNQIEVSASATRYDNLHLRLVRNRGLLANGSVDTDVQAMQPTQPAAFYAQLSLLKAEAAIASTATMEVRYEGRRNHWSAWTALAASPLNSLCTQLNGSVLVRTYGWAG